MFYSIELEFGKGFINASQKVLTPSLIKIWIYLIKLKLKKKQVLSVTQEVRRYQAYDLNKGRGVRIGGSTFGIEFLSLWLMKRVDAIPGIYNWNWTILVQFIDLFGSKKVKIMVMMPCRFYLGIEIWNLKILVLVKISFENDLFKKKWFIDHLTMNQNLDFKLFFILRNRNQLLQNDFFGQFHTKALIFTFKFFYPIPEVKL